MTEAELPPEVLSWGDEVLEGVVKHLHAEGVIDSTRVTELDLEIVHEERVRVTHVETEDSR